MLLGEYAKEHVLTCLVPALFIAGAIAAFVRKGQIMRFLGRDAKKHVSYGIASVSGIILAVCSCTILPLFAGIRRSGAGLGPAITFLFAGPAINIAAIFLTISVLGIQIGIGRIVLAITISILVGLTMALIFREKLESSKMHVEDEKGHNISSYSMALFFFFLLGIIIVNGLPMLPALRIAIIAGMIAAVAIIALAVFPKDARNKWLEETWGFSKLILPLLFIGVFIAGFIMPLIPDDVITNTVGQNNILGNVIASLFGAIMYFSTLTEIPIIQGLLSKGMHHGPALSLLLAGPSLSLPNMLVIRGILGNKKTFAYIGLAILYSAIGGFIFGSIIL
jgi:uncharacterized protein